MITKQASISDLDELLDLLIKKRWTIVYCYLAIYLIFLTVYVLFSVNAISTIIHGILGSPGAEDISELKVMKEGIGARILVTICFFGLQLLFVWSSGFHRVLSIKKKIMRGIIFLVIVATLATLITLIFIMSFFSYTGLMLYLDDSAKTIYYIIGGTWALWLIIGSLATVLKKKNIVMRETILSLFVGSWLSWIVALMVDVSMRHRLKGCAMLLMSHFAVLICLPALIFAVGPAIYLLFCIEKDAMYSREAAIKLEE